MDDIHTQENVAVSTPEKENQMKFSSSNGRTWSPSLTQDNLSQVNFNCGKYELTVNVKASSVRESYLSAI